MSRQRRLSGSLLDPQAEEEIDRLEQARGDDTGISSELIGVFSETRQRENSQRSLQLNGTNVVLKETEKSVYTSIACVGCQKVYAGEASLLSHLEQVEECGRGIIDNADIDRMRCKKCCRNINQPNPNVNHLFTLLQHIKMCQAKRKERWNRQVSSNSWERPRNNAAETSVKNGPKERKKETQGEATCSKCFTFFIEEEELVKHMVKNENNCRTSQEGDFKAGCPKCKKSWSSEEISFNSRLLHYTRCDGVSCPPVPSSSNAQAPNPVLPPTSFPALSRTTGNVTTLSVHTNSDSDDDLQIIDCVQKDGSKWCLDTTPTPDEDIKYPVQNEDGLLDNLVRSSPQGTPKPCTSDNVVRPSTQGISKTLHSENAARSTPQGTSKHSSESTSTSNASGTSKHHSERTSTSNSRGTPNQHSESISRPSPQVVPKPLNSENSSTSKGAQKPSHSESFVRPSPQVVSKPSQSIPKPVQCVQSNSDSTVTPSREHIPVQRVDKEYVVIEYNHDSPLTDAKVKVIDYGHKADIPVQPPSPPIPSLQNSAESHRTPNRPSLYPVNQMGPPAARSSFISLPKQSPPPPSLSIPKHTPSPPSISSRAPPANQQISQSSPSPPSNRATSTPNAKNSLSLTPGNKRLDPIPGSSRSTPQPSPNSANNNNRLDPIPGSSRPIPQPSPNSANNNKRLDPIGPSRPTPQPSPNSANSRSDSVTRTFNRFEQSPSPSPTSGINQRDSTPVRINQSRFEVTPITVNRDVQSIDWDAQSTCSSVASTATTPNFEMRPPPVPNRRETTPVRSSNYVQPPQPPLVTNQRPINNNGQGIDWEAQSEYSSVASGLSTPELSMYNPSEDDFQRMKIKGEMNITSLQNLYKKCKYCNLNFERFLDGMKHFNERHWQKRCPGCLNLVNAKDNNYKDHLKEKHFHYSKRTGKCDEHIRCKFCNERFHYESIWDHIANVHVDPPVATIPSPPETELIMEPVPPGLIPQWINLDIPECLNSSNTSFESTENVDVVVGGGNHYFTPPEKKVMIQYFLKDSNPTWKESCKEVAALLKIDTKQAYRWFRTVYNTFKKGEYPTWAVTTNGVKLYQATTLPNGKLHVVFIGQKSSGRRDINSSSSEIEEGEVIDDDEVEQTEVISPVNGQRLSRLDDRSRNLENDTRRCSDDHHIHNNRHGHRRESTSVSASDRGSNHDTRRHSEPDRVASSSSGRPSAEKSRKPNKRRVIESDESEEETEGARKNIQKTPNEVEDGGNDSDTESCITQIIPRTTPARTPNIKPEPISNRLSQPIPPTYKMFPNPPHPPPGIQNRHRETVSQRVPQGNLPQGNSKVNMHPPAQHRKSATENMPQTSPKINKEPPPPPQHRNQNSATIPEKVNTVGRQNPETVRERMASSKVNNVPPSSPAQHRSRTETSSERLLAATSNQNKASLFRSPAQSQTVETPEKQSKERSTRSRSRKRSRNRADDGDSSSDYEPLKKKKESSKNKESAKKSKSTNNSTPSPSTSKNVDKREHRRDESSEKSKPPEKRGNEKDTRSRSRSKKRSTNPANDEDSSSDYEPSGKKKKDSSRNKDSERNKTPTNNSTPSTSTSKNREKREHLRDKSFEESEPPEKRKRCSTESNSRPPAEYTVKTSTPSKVILEKTSSSSRGRVSEGTSQNSNKAVEHPSVQLLVNVTDTLKGIDEEIEASHNYNANLLEKKVEECRKEVERLQKEDGDAAMAKVMPKLLLKCEVLLKKIKKRSLESANSELPSSCPPSQNKSSKLSFKNIETQLPAAAPKGPQKSTPKPHTSPRAETAKTPKSTTNSLPKSLQLVQKLCHNAQKGVDARKKSVSSDPADTSLSKEFPTGEYNSFSATADSNVSPSQLESENVRERFGMAYSPREEATPPGNPPRRHSGNNFSKGGASDPGPFGGPFGGPSPPHIVNNFTACRNQQESVAFRKASPPPPGEPNIVPPSLPTVTNNFRGRGGRGNDTWRGRGSGQRGQGFKRGNNNNQFNRGQKQSYRGHPNNYRGGNANWNPPANSYGVGNTNWTPQASPVNSYGGANANWTPQPSPANNYGGGNANWTPQASPANSYGGGPTNWTQQASPTTSYGGGNAFWNSQSSPVNTFEARNSNWDAQDYPSNSYERRKKAWSGPSPSSELASDCDWDGPPSPPTVINHNHGNAVEELGNPKCIAEQGNDDWGYVREPNEFGNIAPNSSINSFWDNQAVPGPSNQSVPNQLPPNLQYSPSPPGENVAISPNEGSPNNEMSPRVGPSGSYSPQEKRHLLKSHRGSNGDNYKARHTQMRGVKRKYLTDLFKKSKPLFDTLHEQFFREQPTDYLFNVLTQTDQLQPLINTQRAFGGDERQFIDELLDKEKGYRNEYVRGKNFKKDIARVWVLVFVYARNFNMSVDEAVKDFIDNRKFAKTPNKLPDIGTIRKMFLGVS